MPSDDSPFDPEPFAAGLRRINAREQQRIQRSADSARETARKLAHRIATEVPGVRSIYLFGSLLNDIPGNADFDIDLAVDGGDVYAAMAICETVPWSVDVVDLKHARTDVASRIQKTGHLLYRAENGERSDGAGK